MAKQAKSLGCGYKAGGDKYTRGCETAAVQLPSGRETVVAHGHKNGVGLMYWYWVRMACGGWVEFDIRDVGGDEQAFEVVACTPAALAKVAEFLTENTIDGLA
ncbi:hypothetical protein [Hymenobacter sp. PAMC 26628]|uniref:hypothetical protein n=1 Tax=Hymenobacter sp. PAMC 26628 TaxID=1484118 RepID=UPI00077057F1|nr:hypothetical protein [Hymenobacter sp. PAMC 26628]AMJ65021.1 hypothetical protein AXW84_05970 [Hymenobacter sp. PAMC 26628]